MTITKRTLERWRKEALETEHKASTDQDFGYPSEALELCQRILRMTAELLDQHLLRK